VQRKTNEGSADRQTDRHLKHKMLSDLCAHRIEKISKSTLVNNKTKHKTKLLQEAGPLMELQQLRSSEYRYLTPFAMS
jgi:hypothetical protein